MRRRWLAFAALGLLAGCASPDPAFYTLRAVPGAPVAAPREAVKILRPGLAGYLDRPEIVRDDSVNRLTINSGERWGEPLGDMIGRVLALDLSQRLPASSVFTEAGALTVDPTVQLAVDILRFDLDSRGDVVMEAQISVTRGRAHDASNTRSVRLVVQPGSRLTPDVVTAMSQALGQMADQVAAIIAALPPARRVSPY